MRMNNMNFILNKTIGLCNEVISSGDYNLLDTIEYNYNLLLKSNKIKDSELVELKNAIEFTKEEVTNYHKSMEYKIHSYCYIQN